MNPRVYRQIDDHQTKNGGEPPFGLMRDDYFFAKGVGRGVWSADPESLRRFLPRLGDGTILPVACCCVWWNVSFHGWQWRCRFFSGRRAVSGFRLLILL